MNINDGANIYFSSSIKGLTNNDPEFNFKIVKYLKNKGFRVLSEHVAGLSKKEKDDLFLKNTGIDIRKLENTEPWTVAYKVDMDWVDKADYLIAIVDGPSHGVGMEIMIAILKEERGLNRTEIVCLVHKDNLNNLSWMIRGIPKKYLNFQLQPYTDFDSVISILDAFLNTNTLQDPKNS